MSIDLIPSPKRITAGHEVTFKIADLESHTDGGTYIVRWSIDPSGRLTPVTEVLGDRGRFYSVFPAESARRGRSKVQRRRTRAPRDHIGRRPLQQRAG